MSMWGQRWGDYWGDAEVSITGLTAVPSALGTGALTARWSGAHPAAWYKVYVDGCLRATTRAREITLDGTPGAHHVVEVIDVGPLNGDPAYDPAFAVGAAPGDKVRLTWDVVYELRDDNDQSLQLDNWTLNGAVRSVPRFHPLSPREGRLYVSLTDTGGQRTVDLYEDAARTSLVASGTRTGDGTVTLAAVGGSGVSGQVDVTYTADDTDITLAIDWAPVYAVYGDNGTGTVDFAQPLALVDDPNADTAAHLTGALADGTYKFVIRARDAAGNESADTATLTVVVSTWPVPPSGLTVQYTGAGAYTLNWNDSTSADVTKYRVYVSAADAAIDYGTFAAEVNPGVETYGGSGLSAAGVYRFAVRAYDGTYEERNTYEVEFEIDASLDPLSPRPEIPHGVTATPVAGGDIRVDARYDRTLEQVAATEMRFYWDNGTGTVDFATPFATVALIDGLREAGASAAKTGLTGGATYRFACKAATASGIESLASAEVAAVSDDASPPVPAGATAAAVRCL